MEINTRVEALDEDDGAAIARTPFQSTGLSRNIAITLWMITSSGLAKLGMGREEDGALAFAG